MNGAEIDDTRDNANANTTKQSRKVLEGFKRCSDSNMWKLMMDFYDEKGINSWAKGIVPSFVTSNAFIGRSYAKIIAGYISDLCSSTSATPMDPNEKFYIVELGAPPVLQAN